MANAAELQRYARYAAELWSDPGQFKGPREFLAALTEVMDELTTVAGKQPAGDLPDYWAERYGN